MLIHNKGRALGNYLWRVRRILLQALGQTFFQQKSPLAEGINMFRQSEIGTLGFHNWTPAVFIRMISNGLSLGSDLGLYA